MSTQTISIDPQALIHVEAVGGSLQADGWDRPEVQARGSQLRLQQSTDSVEVSCSGDVVLSIPRTARLRLDKIGGDARVQNLDAAVQIGVVGGDVDLLNLSGSVELSGAIGGDTHMQNVGHVSMSPGRAGLGSDLAQNIRRKIQHAARHADRALQRAELRSRVVDTARWRSTVSQSPDSFPAGNAVSDEERLTVLKMLQDKKITAEQAEKLLAALESNSG